MTNVNDAIRIIDKYTILVKDTQGNNRKDSAGNEIKKRLLQPEEIYIDDIGVGRGCTDRLIELNYRVNGVSVGERPYDPRKYKNIKAENSWNAAVWLKNEGKLQKDDRWQQASWI